MNGPKTDWLLSAPNSATNKKAQTPLFPFLARLIRGEDLSETEAAEFFVALTGLNADQVQIAGTLAALTAKGETSEELAGMASVMRSSALSISTDDRSVVDISGTGSSTAKTFNISTAAALVAAGAGLTVAKQCNRGVTSRAGSADVLGELGVKVAGERSSAQAALDGTGLCFLFAPKFHPSLRRVGDVRRSLGIRTCLNVLGILANPAGVKRQIAGVWHPSLVEPVARALSHLGTDRSWVVHGEDGLDELTIAAPNQVAEISGQSINKFKVSANDFGLKGGNIDHLRTTTAKESARIIRDVLGSKRRDEARSLVVLNAAAALLIGGLSRDPMHAARLAEQSIDSGQAQNKLERLVQSTNKK